MNSYFVMNKRTGIIVDGILAANEDDAKKDADREHGISRGRPGDLRAWHLRGPGVPV